MVIFLRKSLSAGIAIILTSSQVFAQEKLIASFSVNSIQHASVDRIGNLIVQLNDHELKSYSPDGNLIGTYMSKVPITSVDTWNGIRILIFQKADYPILWLDASLEKVDTYKLDSAFVISPLVICATPDFNTLVIDSATWSLKLIDVRNNVLKSEHPLPVTDPPLEIKEYQGFIFLKTLNNLLVLNKMGKLIKTFSTPSLTYFSFLGEELYYKQGEAIVFYDLLDGTQRTEKAATEIILHTQDRTYHIDGKVISIFIKNGQ